MSVTPSPLKSLFVPAICHVAHDDVVDAVAVEIGVGSRDLPISGERRDVLVAFTAAVAAHQPAEGLTRPGVANQQVGRAVAVEVARSLDTPVVEREFFDVGVLRTRPVTVHQPCVDRPAALVDDQQVVHSVPVEIDPRGGGVSQYRTCCQRNQLFPMHTIYPCCSNLQFEPFPNPARNHTYPSRVDH